MKIFLPQLANAPNGKIFFDYSINLADVEVNFESPFERPVHISGNVSDGAGMLRLEGVIEAEVFTSCARCGKPICYDKRVEIAFMLAKTLCDEDIDDIWVVESDEVELDDIFVPELILAMDMTALCDEDCRGLCPKCGADLNLGECGCDRRVIDPRLEKLAELAKQLEQDNKN